MTEREKDTLATVRRVLKDIVPEQKIQLRRALGRFKGETPRFVEVRVSALHYGMPDAEWERHKERMANVRTQLAEAELLHAPHYDVVLVLNDLGMETEDDQGGD